MPIIIVNADSSDYYPTAVFPQPLAIDDVQGAGRWFMTGISTPASAEVELTYLGNDGQSMTFLGSGVPGRGAGVIRFEPNEYPLALVNGYIYPAFELPWVIS